MCQNQFSASSTVRHKWDAWKWNEKSEPEKEEEGDSSFRLKTAQPVLQGMRIPSCVWNGLLPAWLVQNLRSGAKFCFFFVFLHSKQTLARGKWTQRCFNNTGHRMGLVNSPTLTRLVAFTGADVASWLLMRKISHTLKGPVWSGI